MTSNPTPQARERLDASQLASREAGLNKDLSGPQLIMRGLGGAIGTGFFMGSGVAIGYAGPAVIVSYAIAAIAAVAIVFSLSEMAVMHPTAGSFGTYAEIYLNPWAGFITRYSYWMAQVIAVGAEAVAAGLYMTFYFPGTPVWMWSLGFAFVLLYFNSRSVNNFGSIEYWFALIKVVAIVIFIILGAATIFGLWTEPVGFHNLTGLPGGFMPKGFSGVWLAVILGVLSFNGIEVIAVTSGEAKDPVRTIPAALRTMALRLFLFYILALTIVVTFVPWTETGACILAAGGLSKLTPEAYGYLFGVALFDAMIVWIIILLSHLSFRRRHNLADLPVRTPGFPVVQLVGLGLLAAILVTMGLDKEIWYISWVVGVPWLLLLSAGYFIMRARRARIAAAGALALKADAG